MQRQFAHKLINTLVVHAVVISVAFSVSRGMQNVELLEMGKPVERELKGGETHLYRITLADGQFLSATVEQRGVDVVVALIGPDKLPILGIDGVKDTQGTESISAVALTPGIYHLGVQSQRKDAVAGRYEVKITELRAASPAEKNSIGAETAFGQGEMLRQQRKPEALQKSIEKYSIALPLYRAAQNSKSEAVTLVRMGTVYNLLGKKQEALDSFEQAFTIRNSIGDRAGAAATLNNLADIYNSQGDWQKAITTFEQSLKILRDLKNQPRAEAIVLNNLGAIYGSHVSKQKALEYFDQALSIYNHRASDDSGKASTLNSIGKAYDDLGEKEKALTNYDQALSLANTIGAPAIQASILNNIGKFYGDRGDNQTALIKFEQALKIWRDIGDQGSEAVTLSNIGSVYSSLGNKDKAHQYFTDAIKLHQLVNDRAGEAATLNNLGVLYDNTGDRKKALDYYEQALSKVRAAGDRSGEARTLNNLGSVYDAIGEKQKALDYYGQALPVQRDIGDRTGMATTLNNRATVYHSLGYTNEAIDHYSQALKFYQEVRDPAGEATALNNLGGVYKDRGEEQKALDNFTKAGSIYRTVGNPRGEAATFNNIGTVYYELGERLKAVDNFAQALSKASAAGDRPAQATAFNNLGTVHVQQGERQQALKYFEQALLLHKAAGDLKAQAVTQNNLGVVYSETGERQKELEHFTESLRLRILVGDRIGQAITLNNIGLTHYFMGEKSKAREHYERALSLMRAVDYRSGEAGVLGNIGLLQEALGEKSRALEFYLQAIDISERFREGTTIEEIKVGLAQRAAPTYERAALLLVELGQREKAFDLTERARARTFLDQIGNVRLDVSRSPDPQLVEQERLLEAKLRSLDQLLKNEIAGPVDRNENLIKSLDAERSTNRRLYEDLLTRIKLKNPEYASLRSILPLQLGEVQKLLDPNTTLLSYFILDEKTLAFVITRNSFNMVEVPVSSETLAATVRAFRRFDNTSEARSEDLEKLYVWLIAPLKRYIRTPVIGTVPHGILHYLPFAALTDGKSYLGERYRLFYLPSASVLKFIRDKDKPSGRRMLAIAQASSTGLPQLSYVDDEVKTVAGLYGAKPFLTDSLSTAEFQKMASGFNLIHIAAHAEYNSANPLFTRIMIGGKEEEIGLAVKEIYKLDLAKVNIVVLSACKTQLGPYSKGDDIIGLNRAFIYAGTPAVIASLWSVDDASTGELMKAFYTNLKRGLTRSAALQAAQSKVRKKNPHPYYWAGFVLTGGLGRR